MSLRRWGRKVKSLAAKGSPGTMLRHVEVRADPPTGRKRQFHFTKGWRRFEDKK